MRSLDSFKTLNVDEENRRIFVMIDPRLFPVEVVVMAMEQSSRDLRCFARFRDEHALEVEAIPRKSNVQLETAAEEFYDNLVAFRAYQVQSDRNAAVKEMLIRKALE